MMQLIDMPGLMLRRARQEQKREWRVGLGVVLFSMVAAMVLFRVL